MGKPSGSGSGSVTVRGTSGPDTLLVPSSSTLLRTAFEGGRGYDTLDLTNYSSSGVSIRLEGGYAKSKGSWATESAFLGSLYSFSSLGDSTTVRGSIRDVEAVVGTGGNDFLAGNINGAYIRLEGGDGNDALQAWGSISGATLIGGSGSDWFETSNNNTTIVGGVLNASQSDGEMDVFSLAGAATILDFEPTIDRLVFIVSDHSMDAAFANGTWVSDGAVGSILMVNGQAEVTLANIPVPDSGSIEWGFLYSAQGGALEGGGGDDILICYNGTSDTVTVGANSGDDLICQFDLLNDILLFEDDIIPTWGDTQVNGLASLLGTFDGGGSITLTGLTTADVSAINIQGYAGPALFAADGPSPWSANSDAVVPI